MPSRSPGRRASTATSLAAEKQPPRTSAWSSSASSRTTPDLAQQLNKFQEAITAQPDGIIINCGLGPDEAYLDLIAQANEAGIAVGCSAAPPPGSGPVK